MLESTGNAMIISLIDIIDLQVTQTVLDDVTNLGDDAKRGRPLTKNKIPYFWRHEIKKGSRLTFRNI